MVVLVVIEIVTQYIREEKIDMKIYHQKNILI